MANNLIDIEEARKFFSYNPENGNIVRIVSASQKKAGEIASCMNQQGYLRTKINSKYILVHRLAWLLH